MHARPSGVCQFSRYWEIHWSSLLLVVSLLLSHSLHGHLQSYSRQYQFFLAKVSIWDAQGSRENFWFQFTGQSLS